MRPVLALAALLLAACEPQAPESNAFLLVPAAELPALTGRVVDRADLLPAAEETRLSAASEALERRTGDQLVVVTVPSLHGRDIVDFGVSLGRFWRIGLADRNNGVLLIVAPRERRARIDVGCGLERALPDEDADAIMQQRMIPSFGQGDFAAGIRGGTEAIVRTLTGRAAIARGGEC